jgi:hypothetical protein
MSRYYLAETNLSNIADDKSKNYRGLNVFTLSELKSMTGTNKRGEMVTGEIQYPFFSLLPEERMNLMQSSSYVQAVVGSRMNRIASLDWSIVHKKETEEQTNYEAKELKQLYDEFDDPTDLKHLMVRYRIKKVLKKEFPDLRDDLNNFEASLFRYKKRVERSLNNKKEEITLWLEKPNLEDYFDDWIKKFVESLMVHGATCLFKDFLGENNQRLDNFYILPGGTVYPMRSVHVGSYVGYMQLIGNFMPKIYFQDEVEFTNYLPSAARSHGYVPLDALINKIAEQLMFDQYSAERADGTKEPEKLIVFGENRTMLGDLTGDINLPMNKAEQKRIEEKVNTIRKGAVATVSGVGTPVVEDISKADTFAAQSERQDKLLRDIALVFNMTNMEINLAGGEFTSGKETSETQQEIEEGKGTRPIVQKIETILNKAIIPFRYSPDYLFQYKKGLTEFEQVKLDTMKFGSGTYTKNEIRSQRGDDPKMEPGNDTLNQPQGQADGSPFAPFNMRSVENA